MEPESYPPLPSFGFLLEPRPVPNRLLDELLYTAVVNVTPPPATIPVTVQYSPFTLLAQEESQKGVANNQGGNRRRGMTHGSSMCELRYIQFVIHKISQCSRAVN